MTAALVYPLTGWSGSVVAFGLNFFGLICQRILGPDLDVDGFTYNEYLAKKLNPVFGYIWTLTFLPYAKVLPHRSFFSHFPVISTLIRIAYLFFPFYLLSVFDVKPLQSFFFYAVNYWDWTLYFIIGLIWGDWFHFVLDYNNSLKNYFERQVGKAVKRSRNRRRLDF